MSFGIARLGPSRNTPGSASLVSPKPLHAAREGGVIGSRDGFRYTSRDRCGLEDRVAEADRRPRAHRARCRAGRGSRAGCAGRGARAVARVRRAAQSGRLADGRREAPRDRSLPPATSCSSASIEELGYELEAEQEAAVPDFDAALDDDVGDDLLRLVFTACHPVLSTEARVALTLRLLGGLTTERDGARVPCLGADNRAAHRPSQANAGRQARPVRGPARRGAGRPPVVGARGHLSRLQRRLFGDGRRRLDAARPLRGCAAAGADSGRAGAAGAGGARPRRA